VLVEETAHQITGRAAHQGPEVDGNVALISRVPLLCGDLVDAVVSDSDGVDLVATTIVDQQQTPIGWQELRSP
jgi:ribosomal protein S12 methylthiotransferase